MILHDRVVVLVRELLRDENGQPIYDGYGNDQYVDVETFWPAEVSPLSSSETVFAGSQVESRYRVVLPAAAVEKVKPSSSIKWRGKAFEVEGDVEPHTLRGRVHHVEFIAHRVTG